VDGLEDGLVLGLVLSLVLSLVLGLSKELGMVCGHNLGFELGPVLGLVLDGWDQLGLDLSLIYGHLLNLGLHLDLCFCDGLRVTLLDGGTVAGGRGAVTLVSHVLMSHTTMADGSVANGSVANGSVADGSVANVSVADAEGRTELMAVIEQVSCRQDEHAREHEQATMHLG